MLYDSKFKNPLIRWIDSRLPIFTLMHHEYIEFQMPKNVNYMWAFGAIAMLMLMLMIVTGIMLAMQYTANTNMAFASVERIMRDVDYGWLLRYLHSNAGTFFFGAVYIHMLRGLYYGSYQNPRELLWVLGCVIYLLMVMTGFLGYVLPWGQMSFWAATVITSLFSAFPVVGDPIVTWLWGGFSVDNPTLNRFYALHYLLPFVLLAVVVFHVAALHIVGSNNPLGVDPKGPEETVPFHPYVTIKDLFAFSVLLIVFAVFVFFAPNYWGHPDNYIPANPMVTPPHIVPEWYYLWLYAILRGIPDKLGGTVAMFAAVIVLFVIPWLDTSKVRSLSYRPISRVLFWVLVVDLTVLSFCGANPPEGAWVIAARIGTFYFFLHFLVLMPLLGKFEKTLPVPASISDSLKKTAAGVAAMALVAGVLAFAPAAARAEGIDLPAQSWAQSGPFGAFDKAQVRRGFQVFKEVCSSCHSLNLVPYRILYGIGYTEDQVKAIAKEYGLSQPNGGKIEDTNDQGEPIQRDALPSDRFARPYPNEKAARAAWNGALPPDLSVITKARHGGEDYVTALLTGYQDPPAGVTLPPGRFYNKYFPGHAIAMPQMLSDDNPLAYEDHTKATALQEAQDVGAFLAYVAEPTQDERKHLGIRVILFLVIFTGLMYACKRALWHDVAH
jgi:ubiquinol-cytochrome c reductase cytochrome b/c1 subunit